VIFGITAITLGIINHAAASAEEWQRFKEMCDSMGNEGKVLMQKRLDRMRLDEQRRHEIAVADAGRARNFWGN